MPETNYPANSDRAQQTPPPAATAERHVKRGVISGGVKQKNHEVRDKVMEFFGLEEMHTFRDYVSFVSDITNRIYGAMDMLMGNRRSGNVPAARVAYGQPYRQGQQNPQQGNGNARQRATANYSYNDLIFDNRGDAEVVLSSLYELLGTYRAVSVADLFDLAELSSPNGYTDNKFGWTDLSGARVISVSGGYMIDLPRAMQL